jgi:hypothetical protein
MYFTWIFIGLLILYSSLFFWLPITEYPAFAFLGLITLWFVDWMVTIKRKKLTVQRIFPVPIYQNHKTLIQIAIFNPSRFGQRVVWKDEPPFEASISAN